jgi:RNA polymerase sigma factor (sigma-70 family)
VWGACRRGLPDPADAEDAFQATFLVLVRRANRLTGSATVGPWLYRVAAWTAGNLRRKNARRLARRRELSDAVPDHRPAPESSFDLDTALLALSERCRAALVLCCLEGMTHREAALRLGCAEGTVSSLVSRGLAKLRVRLAGRDPAAALAVAAAVLVPNSLSAVAARSAAAFRVLSAAASPAVTELTEGVLRMFWVKKATAAGLVATAVLTLGLGIGLTGTPAGPTAAADPPKSAAEKPTDDRTRKPQTPQEELLRLEQEQQLIAAREQELAVMRQQLAAQVAKLKADLAARREAPGRRLVVIVGGRTSLPPVTVTEQQDGRPVWSVTFPSVTWTDPDWSPVRDFLARTWAAPNGPKVAVVAPEPAAPTEHVRALMQACRDAGFEPSSVSAVNDTRPTVTSESIPPADEPMMSSVGLQVAVPEGGAITSGPEGALITIPVGGTARLTLSRGKFVELRGGRVVPPGGGEGDVISPSINALGVITIRGLKPGEGSAVRLTDDQGGKHTILITVIEKGPGR